MTASTRRTPARAISPAARSAGRCRRTARPAKVSRTSDISDKEGVDRAVFSFFVVNFMIGAKRGRPAGRPRPIVCYSIVPVFCLLILPIIEEPGAAAGVVDLADELR